MRIACSDLSLAFPSPEGPVEAIAGLGFETREGEFLSIVGPSGCGKSTLLRILAGLLQPTAGAVARTPDADDESDRVLLVFQEQSLFPWMTVLDNAAFGLEMQGVGRSERTARAMEILTRLGLDGRETAYPHQLSVGMKQRVAIARAFLADHAVLLMDEPFAALDSLTRRALQKELLELWRHDLKTVVFVTHDVDEAILLSDRIAVMSAQPGRLVAEETIPFERPRDHALAWAPEFAAIKRRILASLESPSLEESPSEEER